jgi:capsular polysaccharide biosynthesis protein
MFNRKSPADHGIWFCLKNTYQTHKSLKSNKMIYISRHGFNSKRRTKRLTGNPRQITGFGFALKTPTKLKIHLNPTK